MRISLLPLLCLLPLQAFAQASECRHSQDRNLQLDLVGVTTVVFDIANNEVNVAASPGAGAAVTGQACASEKKLLDQLVMTQKKAGGKLLVTARREGMSSGLFSRKNHAHMKLAATVPDGVAVQLIVGSGKASVTGARIASGDVGSGHARLHRTRELAAAKVGSGSIEIVGAGSLNVISVGSGDLKAKDIRRSVKVGSIGSGGFALDGAQGDVSIGSVGSGDADLRRIAGNVQVGSLGSGKVGAHDIRGDLVIESVGSGSVEHSGVVGQLRLPGEK